MTEEQVSHTAIRRRRRRVVILVALVLVVAAAYIAFPRLTATNIGAINADPEAFAVPGAWVGRRVNLYGTVVEHTASGFRMEDGTGRIHVATNAQTAAPLGSLPPLGTRVWVDGAVSVLVLGNEAGSFVSVEIIATSVVPWAL